MPILQKSGVAVTFILLMCVSVFLIVDTGADVIAYMTILLLLLLLATILLVASRTMGRRFISVLTAYLSCASLSVAPMLTFVETETYQDGTTVSPGHSGVQTMSETTRVTLGIIGAVWCVILTITYLRTSAT